jgi:hypothetical protein
MKDTRFCGLKSRKRKSASPINNPNMPACFINPDVLEF